MWYFKMENTHKNECSLFSGFDPLMALSQNATNYKNIQ